MPAQEPTVIAGSWSAMQGRCRNHQTKNRHPNMSPTEVRALKLTTVMAMHLFASAGCAALPDADGLIERHSGQTARFENASGPVSAQKSAAILEKLKRKSGDID